MRSLSDFPARYKFSSHRLPFWAVLSLAVLVFAWMLTGSLPLRDKLSRSSPQKVTNALSKSW